MSSNYLPFLLFIGLLFHACSNDKLMVDENAGISSEIVMSLGVRGANYVSETDENNINTVSIFSFVQKPGQTAYTYEKTFLDLVPSAESTNTELSLTLDGSLPRILYFVANDVTKIPFLTHLWPGTLSTAADEQALVMDFRVPQVPLTMVSRVQLNDPSSVSNLPVEFTHTVSRLDIVNKYAGFVIDSMIVRNAILGTYAFRESFATELLPHADLKYTDSPVYLYHASNVVLSIYGKYNGIRAVFDIDLKDIRKATRYNVIVRSINDHAVDFMNNLAWEVMPWTEKEPIDSTPDWK